MNITPFVIQYIILSIFLGAAQNSASSFLYAFCTATWQDIKQLIKYSGPTNQNEGKPKHHFKSSFLNTFCKHNNKLITKCYCIFLEKKQAHKRNCSNCITHLPYGQFYLFVFPSAKDDLTNHYSLNSFCLLCIYTLNTMPTAI